MKSETFIPYKGQRIPVEHEIMPVTDGNGSHHLHYMRLNGIAVEGYSADEVMQAMIAALDEIGITSVTEVREEIIAGRAKRMKLSKAATLQAIIQRRF